MDNQHRKQLEDYLAKIEKIAQHAEELEPRVDAEYRQILRDEVSGYRELIALWRKRLAS